MQGTQYAHHGTLGYALVVASLPVSATGGGQFKDLLNKAKQSTSSSSQLGSGLPNSDIASGLKQALAKGTTDAINSLGRKDGFWKNAKVRIPLPGKLEQAGNLARKMTLSDARSILAGGDHAATDFFRRVAGDMACSP